MSITDYYEDYTGEIVLERNNVTNKVTVHTAISMNSQDYHLKVVKAILKVEKFQGNRHRLITSVGVEDDMLKVYYALKDSMYGVTFKLEDASIVNINRYYGSYTKGTLKYTNTIKGTKHMKISKDGYSIVRDDGRSYTLTLHSSGDSISILDAADLLNDD